MIPYAYDHTQQNLMREGYERKNGGGGVKLPPFFVALEISLHFLMVITKLTHFTVMMYNKIRKTGNGGMPMYKILVVDDEEKIREVLREYAEFEGYEVMEAKDGMEGVHICRENRFDAVVMDVMMPRLDGFSACKEIRKFSDVPFLMLSARGEEYDKLFGFEIGVDDYVVKPFSPKEVMARLHVIIHRNSQPKRQEKELIQLQGLTIDMAGRNVYVDGQKAEMTPKEYDLLFYLVRNQNLALTRDKLLNDVWGYEFFGDDRTVDTHIKMLRNSLGKYRDYIVTLRGLGYKFEVEERE